MNLSFPSEVHLSIRRHLAAGAIGVAALCLGIGGWAAATEFSGAVVAPGLLVVESDVKKVQHPAGGIVSELKVKDGDRVRAGDVLLRLDETVLQANLAIVAKAYDEALARSARLEAERDGRNAIAFPSDLTARKDEMRLSALMDAEARQFELRRAGRQGQISQLGERVGQLTEQVNGLTEQLAAKQRELDLIARELEGVRELWAKKLVAVQRVTALERDLARTSGEKGALMSSIAQTQGRITETRLQILQVDQDLRAEVGKELNETQARLAEYVERKVSAQDQLKRVVIRAPQDGTVHQSAVHTIGGVVGPGETLMLIVPTSDHLVVEARIPPREIDQVHQSQRATLRFSAFNQRTTPEIDGEVVKVTPDLTTDPRTGQGFYSVRIALPEEQVRRLGGARLTPGMPVEAFIRTQARTVLTYFTKPFGDQVARAFRER